MGSVGIEESPGRTEAASGVGGRSARADARWAPAFAWSLVILSALTGAAALVVGIVSGERAATAWQAPTIGLIFPGVGALIASRHPRNAVGWVFIATGFLYALSVAADAYAHHGLEGRTVFLPLAREAVWLANWIWVPALALLMTYTPLLFPDGRPPSRRWRWVAWIAGAGLVLALVPFAVASWLHRGPAFFGGVDDVPALDWTVYPASAGFALVGISAIGAIAALVVRFRRSVGLERQQLKWFVFAAVIFLLVAFNAFTPWPLPEPAMVLAFAGIPVAAGIAILKHRLYDLDLVINRSLVYGTLTVLVVGVYVGVVTLLGRLFQGLGGSLAATGVVAVLFHPLRERVQRVINRLMYGERDDPYAVLAKLGRRLEASLPAMEILPGVAATIGEALRLPFVAIELRSEEGLAPTATYGTPSDPAIVLPLVHGGEVIGQLLAAARAPGEELTPSDRDLLEDLARQAGAAAHAVRLASQLQRSRELLVLAREEERRRLRRDLHDGLGPTLAGVALQIENARGLLRENSQAAGQLLERLGEESQDAIRKIREIVEGLRPAALDELGLVAALREEAARFEVGGSSGLRVMVEAPADLGPMAAAVEVAAYRIALEAVTNAARHAGASACAVRISAEDGVLVIEVTDDGVGLAAETRPGTGIATMRERAAELGGSVDVEARPSGGTRLVARLPLEA